MQLKRAIDLTGALTLGILTAPLLAVSAVAIRLTMGSPVLFRQVRIGLHGREFVLFKLRTMTQEASPADEPDRGRITPVGRILRTMSIDELPELWNVVKGDMSLVGPRPLLVEYLPLYTPQQNRRHESRPGITGLAQVLDRNETRWERRFELDVWYVDNRNTWMDLRILTQTIGKVLSGSGVQAKGEVTMARFTGSDPR